MTLYECLRRCTGMCNESRVTCMKNYAWWLCHKYDVNYMIMQWQYDKSNACHDDKRNSGKLHGNISRNGYGNAIIGRYGGCFEEGIWRVYDTGERCAVLEMLAMVEGRKVRIIHGLNISHKELIYLLQKSTSYESKVLRACS